MDSKGRAKGEQRESKGRAKGGQRESKGRAKDNRWIAKNNEREKDLGGGEEGGKVWEFGW